MPRGLSAVADFDAQTTATEPKGTHMPDPTKDKADERELREPRVDLDDQTGQ